jgi:hypothetical protein
MLILRCNLKKTSEFYEGYPISPFQRAARFLLR